ncbi:hypothetical protein [Nocardioides rubriscoriae]|uniref:hypothetical protein n=1 Tax=Nocardioides rubriscoriae TaxID=642762 RepID=UPI0011DF967A|nr:hypothetical protein [Nocardioides rubriscoriae]
MSAPIGSRRAELDPDDGPRILLLVAAAAGLVLVLAVVGYLLLRDDGTDPADAGPTAGQPSVVAPGGTVSSSAPADATEEPDPLDDPMSPASIDLRYESLAASVTTGTDRCRTAKARRGQDERVRCDVPSGTLELVTYTRATDLLARRAEAVTDRPGGVLDASRTRVMMAFQDPAAPTRASAKGPKGKGGSKGAQTKGAGRGRTYLYWDDQRARQSAVYLADAGTDLSVLSTAYDATGPVRPYPTSLTDKQLVAFTRRWVKPDDCLRTVTVNPGAAQESYCDVKGPVEVFVGRFRTKADLEAYRTLVVASAIADKRTLRDWNRAKGGAPVGALYEYTTGDGTVARYWDDSSCLCYAEAFLAQGSYDRLARWWDR